MTETKAVQWKALEDIGELQQGGTLSRNSVGEGTTYQIIQIRNIDALEISGELDVGIFEKVERYLVSAGDVLIGLRTNPVRAAVVLEGFERTVVGSNIARLRVNSEIDAYYIAGLISSEFISGRLSALVGGTVIPSLSTKALKRFKLPIPDLALQQELAKALKSFDRYSVLSAKSVVKRGERLEAQLDLLFQERYD